MEKKHNFKSCKGQLSTINLHENLLKKIQENYLIFKINRFCSKWIEVPQLLLYPHELLFLQFKILEY
jgi:hypothetical protein